MKKDWVILNITTGELYWSNDWGWGDLAGATRFTYDEIQKLHLPVDSRWVQTK